MQWRINVDVLFAACIPSPALEAEEALPHHVGEAEHSASRAQRWQDLSTSDAAVSVILSSPDKLPREVLKNYWVFRIWWDLETFECWNFLKEQLIRVFAF